jgi:glycosyltransferase involved in cell wall biosynthesis
MKIFVTHIQRKKTFFFSVENVFSNLRISLIKSNSVVINLKYAKFPSIGFFKRVGNFIDLWGLKSDIYHILGDIHYVALVFDRRKTILTILDCVSLYNSSKVKRTILFIFWYYIPVLWVKNITVISESVKQELIKLTSCDPNKIKVIPCCISPAFYNEKYVKPFNEGKPIILQIGTTPNKNIEVVSEAISQINCILYIIGKLTDIQEQHLKNCNVEYKNFINLTENQLIDVYCQSDILLFASTYEGFGLPIIEANALGLPVITSNISSMPEVANDAAFLINPLSSDEIIKAIVKIKEDRLLREKLVYNGFINASKYSTDVIASQFENYYLEVFSKV